MAFSSDSLAGYHLVKTMATGPVIHLTLLNEFWTSGEVMAIDTDVTATTVGGLVFGYKASKVKKIGKFPIGALSSLGGQWGAIQFKPGTASKNKVAKSGYTGPVPPDPVDPLDNSDPEIKNALIEPLFSPSNVPFSGNAYRVKDHIHRCWVYQEKRIIGHWELTSTDAVWSVGDWNLGDDPTQKSGETPFPPVDDARVRYALSNVNVTGFETWSAHADFFDYTQNFVNGSFAPLGTTDATFDGPLNGVSGTPEYGDTYEANGVLTLSGTFTSISGTYNYDCGIVTWTVVWTFLEL